jgi:hypothetical protein
MHLPVPLPLLQRAQQQLLLRAKQALHVYDMFVA